MSLSQMVEKFNAARAAERAAEAAQIEARNAVQREELAVYWADTWASDTEWLWKDGEIADDGERLPFKIVKDYNGNGWSFEAYVVVNNRVLTVKPLGQKVEESTLKVEHTEWDVSDAFGRSEQFFTSANFTVGENQYALVAAIADVFAV